MSEPQAQSVPMDQMPELPPMMKQVADQLKSESRRLMKDKETFKDPDQLRRWLAMNLIPNIERMFEMLGITATEHNQMILSNAHELNRVHRWAAVHLEDLGADVDADQLIGISPELVNEFAHAFYALGSALQRVKDPEIEARYNAVADVFGRLIAALMTPHGVGEREPEPEPEGGENGGEREGEPSDSPGEGSGNDGDEGDADDDADQQEKS